MGSRIQCFLIEKTGREFWQPESRSRDSAAGTCPVHGIWHRASGEWREGSLSERDRSILGPERCECGHVFAAEDRTVGSGRHEWRRVDNGEILPIGMNRPFFPPGAMWYADWLEEGVPLYGEEPTGRPLHHWRGPDNRVLEVMTPGGEWIIDSRASNCTRPDDNTHRCWVREGTPPNVTAGKAGNTCQAGAGSILCGSYHGFLRNGWLEEC